jgi:hypothetical protein
MGGEIGAKNSRICSNITEKDAFPVQNDRREATKSPIRPFLHAKATRIDSKTTELRGPMAPALEQTSLEFGPSLSGKRAVARMVLAAMYWAFL